VSDPVVCALYDLRGAEVVRIEADGRFFYRGIEAETPEEARDAFADYVASLTVARGAVAEAQAQAWMQREEELVRKLTAMRTALQELVAAVTKVRIKDHHADSAVQVANAAIERARKVLEDLR